MKPALLFASTAAGALLALVSGADGQTSADELASPGLVPPGAIEGLVVDEAGDPIAAARIDLVNRHSTDFDEWLYAIEGIEPPQPVATVVSDDTGTFRFHGLNPDEAWTLVVTHDRYQREDFSVKVPEGRVWKERVLLYLGQTLSGVVRDARTAQPVAGATLVIDNPLAVRKKKSATRIEASTDAQGVYSFANVKGGQHVLTLSAAGYATQVHNNFSLVTLTEPGTRFTSREPVRMSDKQQDFSLHRGRAIAGRVLGPDGSGISRVEVEATSLTGTVGSTGSSLTTENGEFRIDGLAEGVFAVRVTAEGLDAPAQRVEAGSSDVVVQLVEQARVTGRVQGSDGRPLESFSIKVRTVNPFGPAYGDVLVQQAAESSVDGSFEVRGIPEGAYVLEAMAPGYASSFSEPFKTVQSRLTSEVVVCMSPGGSLGGRVVYTDGAPLADVEVTTREPWNEAHFRQGIYGPSALTRARTRTDCEGRLRLEALTPGVYDLHLEARGFSPLVIPAVEVLDGLHTELPPQNLPRGALVTGIVHGLDSLPSSGAVVQLTPVNPDVPASRMARSDATGRYTIPNVLPGRYDLGATRGSSRTGNPFEVIGDLRKSKIEVSLVDGTGYTFDLHMNGERQK